MPVTLRGSGSSSVISDVSTSFAVNVGSEVDRFLVAGLIWDDFDLVGPSLVSFQCGGVDMHLWSSYNSGTRHNEIYYLAESEMPTGLQTIEAVFSDIATATIGACAFTGVDNVAPLTTAEQANAVGTSNPATATISGVSRQDGIFTLLQCVYSVPGSPPSVSATAGQLKIVGRTVEYDVNKNWVQEIARTIPPTSDAFTDTWSTSIPVTWRMQTVRIKHKQYGASPSQISMGT